MKIILALVCMWLLACTADESAAHAEHSHHAHVHSAPHGGTLVEIGAHQANLECLLDTKTGTLQVYILGPHAERAVRLTVTEIPIEVRLADAEEALLVSLTAQRDELSQYTVGNTALFAWQDERLKNVQQMELLVPSVTIFGETFSGISVSLP